MGSATGLGRAPRTPLDFRHHACVRDADPRVFDALHRGLRQRLYDGRARSRDGVRIAALHQGPSPAWTRGLFVTGCIGLLFAALAASELGRDLRQRSQDGGVYDAAVFVFLRVSASRAFAAVMAALAAAGIWVRRQCRKDVWIVALPAADPGRIDLWLAGTASGRPERFAHEFAALVVQAHAPDPALQPASDAQAASG